MRFLIYIFLLIFPMTVQAGSFFPPEYKHFSFKEGDLLVSESSNGGFAVNKVLKVDRFDLKKGDTINILGTVFRATEDDYLLVVSTAYGKSEFKSFEAARSAANTGAWTVELDHAPSRTPGAAQGQVLVGHQQVKEDELEGYRIWREAFDKGEGGIF